MSLQAELSQVLSQRQQYGLYRQRRTIDSPQGVRISVDGQWLINFCSNDYLGLANHPSLVAAGHQALDQYGGGSGSSHLVCGHSREHHMLEQELARFVGRERALLFSTGYMANVGTVAALCGRGDGVFEDRLNHASLLDGGLLSGARLQRFAHNDVSALDARLADSSSRRKLVVVDGVFSMDGDLAPLPDLADCAEKHGAWLMVDDAHGLGCLGATAGGSVDYWQLSSERVPILVGTLGKALGSAGAFVAGSGALIEYLIQTARPYIYTTAMPPAQAAVTRAALRVCASESWRRDHLQVLINRFREGARTLGLQLMNSATAIQPVVLGDAGAAVDAAEALRQRGFWVVAIRPPTVPQGTSRLRVTLTAEHSVEQVDSLLQAMTEVLV